MSAPKSVVFCGGVHGVGKTKLCKTLADLLGALHVSASALIGINSKDPRSKVVDAPEQDQRQILEVFESIQHEGLIFLDGHFCLIGQDNQIYSVPEDAFMRLAPRALLIVIDDPLTIAARLHQRDLIDPDPEFINRLQTAEASHAEAISRHLAIPLRVVRSNDNIHDTARWIQLVKNT